MRFCSFFARFWVNYRVFLGGCLPFLIDFGVIFFINVYIYVLLQSSKLHCIHTVRAYGWYKLKYTLILSY